MWLMGYRIQSKYVVVLAFLFLLVFTGCTPSHHMSTFDTHGPVARSQLVLFYWIFWAAVFVFVPVSIALFYTVLKYRRRSGDPDPPQIHGHTKLEIAWTIIPSIILIVVAVPTVITIFDNANSPEPSALTIEAKGHQWWFEFTYPHPEEPDKKVVTANELHIPVDEVVNVNLESKDVIHSFWIPKIAGKVDMVPNHTNTIWIKADETGEYYGPTPFGIDRIGTHLRGLRRGGGGTYIIWYTVCSALKGEFFGPPKNPIRVCYCIGTL